MRRRLFGSLVTTKPPKEVANNKVFDVIVQDLSSANPTIRVPQGTSGTAERIKEAYLYDLALTPPGMPGAYGIPSWALDAARVARAVNFAKDKLTRGDLSQEQSGALSREIGDKCYGQGSPAQYYASMARAKLLANTDYECHNDTFDKIVRSKLESWDDVIDLAKSLQEDAGEGARSYQPKCSGDNDGEGDSPQAAEFSPGEGEDADGKEIPASAGNPWAKSSIPKPKGRTPRPGKLENEEPDKLLMHNKRKKASRRRPEMEGVFPSSLYRMYLDGKMFKGAPIAKGARGRGTILVDMSSSMRWDVRDFDNLLQALPECTVFGYVGNSYEGRKSGRWVLLGDRGRVADIHEVEEWKNKIGGSNIIDAPMLQILAKMPSPRIWLSDGGVTGTHDETSDYIYRVCNEAMSRGGILRAPTSEDACNAILGKKAHVYRTC